jgi:hypothetical protein
VGRQLLWVDNEARKCVAWLGDPYVAVITYGYQSGACRQGVLWLTQPLEEPVHVLFTASVRVDWVGSFLGVLCTAQSTCMLEGVALCLCL